MEIEKNRNSIGYVEYLGRRIRLLTDDVSLPQRLQTLQYLVEEMGLDNHLLEILMLVNLMQFVAMFTLLGKWLA